MDSCFLNIQSKALNEEKVISFFVYDVIIARDSRAGLSFISKGSGKHS